MGLYLKDIFAAVAVVFNAIPMAMFSLSYGFAAFPTALGFIVGVLVVLGNLTFIFANRYARFLLLNEYVKKRKLVQINQYIEEHNYNDNDKYNFRNFE